MSDPIKDLWDEITSWTKSEFKLFGSGLVAALKTEIPELTKEAALALEAELGQIAQSIEDDAIQSVKSGAEKKETFLQRAHDLLNVVGLDLVGGGKLLVKAALSAPVQNALVEAAVVGVKAGVVSAAL